MVSVVSFNIGTPLDWQNLAIRAELKKSSGLEMKAGTDKMTFLQACSTVTPSLEAHNEKVRVKLNDLIDKTHATFICMQEFSYASESDKKSYGVYVSTLDERGYSVIGDHDTAIAYKRDEVTPFKSSFMSFDLNNNPLCDKGFVVRPAIIQDFVQKKTGRNIRVVSDHVKGFDGLCQKKRTKEHREIPKDPQARTEYFLSYLHNIANPNPAVIGDMALDISLTACRKNLPEVKPASFVSRLMSSFSSASSQLPPIIIYALDANTTSEDVAKRLHPKRIRLFDLHSFYRDHSSRGATIIDANDFEKRKYDYVAATELVREQIIPGVNNPELLDDPENLISDHLPVSAIVGS